MAASKINALNLTAVAVLLSMCAQTRAVTVTDDFSDDYFTGVNNVSGLEWTVTEQAWAISGGQSLQASANDHARIHTVINDVTPGTASQLSFDLARNFLTQSNYLFRVNLTDTSTGNYYQFWLSTNPAYHNTTGSRMFQIDGADDNQYALVYGADDMAAVDDLDFHRLELNFDPATGVAVSYDGFSYALGMNNAFPLTKVDQIEFIASGGGDVNFLVDNVSFTYVPEPAMLGLAGLPMLMLCKRRRR